MYIYAALCINLNMAKIITRNGNLRYGEPHPIDLKELKKPLLIACNKLDRSIPYLTRIAVKEWLERNFPNELEVK